MRTCITSSILILVLLTAGSTDAVAGRLYARLKGTSSPLYNLRLENIRSTITIREQLAVTHVDEEFRNSEPIELEGFYVFQLPEGARVDGLWMWVDGVRQTFMVKRLAAAIHVYDSLVNAGIGDPAILESLGGNRFQLRIHPIKPNSTRRIELQYFELLTMNEAGVVRYAYPLALAGYQSTVVRNTDVRLTIASSCALDSLVSNFSTRPLSFRVQVVDSSHTVVELSMEDFVQSEDLVLTWKLRRWPDAFHAITYTDPDTSGSAFFMAWHPFRVANEQHAKSDFVFAVDVSGSMCGLRRDITLDAIRQFLSMLQKYDRFRFVLFSDAAISFPADTAMLFADSAGIARTLTALDTLFRPGGLTSYEAALRECMHSAFRSPLDRRIILLTDGLPNIGAATTSALLPLITDQQGVRPHVYPTTLYCEHVAMLSDLAKATGGLVTHVEQGDDLASAITGTAFSFTPEPVLDARIDWPTGVSMVFPTFQPPSTHPLKIFTTGRFTDPTSGDVTLTGRSGNDADSIRIVHPMTLTDDNIGPVQIARCWASQRISALMNELPNVTDSTEIIESIIRLSERYMLLTPWTAFIVVTTIDPPPPTSVEAAGRLAGTFELHQNYPNPFNPATTITFVVPESVVKQRVRLVVHDVLGRVVAVLWDGFAAPGVHRLEWDGHDTSGRPLATGIYFCVLDAAGVTRTITMQLVK